jgi:hypothetical protein
MGKCSRTLGTNQHRLCVVSQYRLYHRVGTAIERRMLQLQRRLLKTIGEVRASGAVVTRGPWHVVGGRSFLGHLVALSNYTPLRRPQPSSRLRLDRRECRLMVSGHHSRNNGCQQDQVVEFGNRNPVRELSGAQNAGSNTSERIRNRHRLCETHPILRHGV